MVFTNSRQLTNVMTFVTLETSRDTFDIYDIYHFSANKGVLQKDVVDHSTQEYRAKLTYVCIFKRRVKRCTQPKIKI